MARPSKSVKSSPEHKLQSLESEVSQVHDWARRELEEVEAQLAVITARRDELARMLEWAQSFPRVSTGATPRRRTLQWSQVERLMTGRGPVDTATIMRLLAEDGFELPKEGRQLVASALHRALEAKKLQRVGRGMYELVSAGSGGRSRGMGDDDRWGKVEALLVSRGELSAKELIAAIRRPDDDKNDQRSRTMLSRWVKQGKLRNPRHGRYELAT